MLLKPINKDKRARRMIIPTDQLLPLIRKGYTLQVIGGIFGVTDECLLENLERIKREKQSNLS